MVIFCGHIGVLQHTLGTGDSKASEYDLYQPFRMPETLWLRYRAHRSFGSHTITGVARRDVTTSTCTLAILAAESCAR